MSRKRRQVLQLDDGSSRDGGQTAGFQDHGTGAGDDIGDELADDPRGDTPTPPRLDGGDSFPAQKQRPGDIDNKVANFLAEIDALDPVPESENGTSWPTDSKDEEPRASFTKGDMPATSTKDVPPSKTGGYGMFVRGRTEFTRGTGHSDRDGKKSGTPEPWPEEPETPWQQVQDEGTQYVYYWNMKTNEVTWDMPPEFTAFLLKQKEYEEKVERGLKDGTLKAENRPKSKSEDGSKESDRPGRHRHEKSSKPETVSSAKSASKSDLKSSSKKRDDSSGSSDSSSDSSSDDSDHSSSRSPRPGASLVPYRQSLDGPDADPVTSTSGSKTKKSSQSDEKEGESRSGSSKRGTREVPDSTNDKNSKARSQPDRAPAPAAAEEMDFDVDDIDKELEMALERKRQELIKLEEEGKKKKEKEERHKSRDEKDRRKDDHRRDDRKRDREGRHRRHDDRRRRDEGKRDRKSTEKEKPKEEAPPIVKLSLKEKIRAEVEVKLEKEKRKKRAIEELMAKELERTVASKSRKRHHRDDYDEGRKRRHHDDDFDLPPRQPREEYDRRREDYRRGYDPYERLPTLSDPYEAPYERRMETASKAPPPTAEMIAYEAERKSQVVDYGHGRSRDYERDGDSDREDRQPADRRELEMKKLEALQLAELALSKLEFLEVTKKGLSKLQILLIELETRHQDWQAGGLTTHHFLAKLREANWQLEQYEESAAPDGWSCHWDRAYRRYFYTHKRSGKSQWDYPDADETLAEDEAGAADPTGVDSEMVSSTTSGARGVADSSQSKKAVSRDLLAGVTLLPPPPPPPAEDHPVVKGLQLMYGSSSGSDSEEEKPKPPKKEPTPPPPLPPEAPPPPPQPEKPKSKKKKKHKSKDSKEIIVTAIGPHLPPPPPPPPEPAPGTSATVAQYGTQPPQEPEQYYPPQPDPSAPLQFGAPVLPEGVVLKTEAAPFNGVAGSTFEGTEYPVNESSIITKGPQLESSVYQPSAPQVQGPEFSYSAAAESQVESMQTDNGAQFREPTAGVSGVPTTEEKKKKKKDKDKSISSSSLALKKKHVSSLVQKWQKVKKEVEAEESRREEREAEIRRNLEEWKAEHP